MPTQVPTRPAPYAPPATITVVPPTFTLGDREDAGRRLVIVLDVEAGRLSAEDWQEGRDPYDRQMPSYYPHRDLYFVGGPGHDWFRRSARRLGWSPHHYPAFPGSPDGFREVLDLMGVWAKELVDALEPLDDGGWDWTLRATAAYERIGYLTSYGRRPLTDGIDPADPWHGDGTAPLPERHHYGIVSFDEILAAAGPSWADPAWMALTDAQLDEVADGIVYPFGKGKLAKWIGGAAEERLKATIRFHGQRQEGRPLAEENQGLPIHPIGVRAGLRRWRAARLADATQLPVQHAGAYFDDDPARWPETLRAASSDTELARIAALVDAEAATDHRVALVGTAGVLTAARADLRTIRRAELAATGDAYTRIAAELRQLGDRRAGLLFEVASFQDGPEWDAEKGEPNYAELGRAARMTRQAVRERLGGEAPAEPDDAERADDARERIIARLTTNGDAGAFYTELDRVAGRILRVPLRPFLAEMAAAGTIARVGGEDSNPRYVLTNVRDADIAASVREHLNGHGRARTAAQLHEATVEALGEYPRSQLDAVLAQMHTAGDVHKNGHVGATYSAGR